MSSKTAAMASTNASASASTTSAAMAGSSTQSGTPAPARARQQNRKKAAAPAPPPVDTDMMYRIEAMAPPPQVHTGSKRLAQDKADGEPRVKRKRVDHSAGATMQLTTSTTVASAGRQQANPKADGENTPSLVDFTTLDTASLYRYIVHHDLVPAIFPSPLSDCDPPPPEALADPSKMASRAPTPNPAPAASLHTVANRPRRGRETKDSGKRRSTVPRPSLDDESRTGVEQVPLLADIQEIHGVLASIASRHFKESSVREVETLLSFGSAVSAKNGRWR